MEILMWLMSLSFTVIILMVVVYQMTGGLFFTVMRENTGKAIVANGRLVKFISNVKGKRVDPADRTGTLKDLPTEDYRDFIKGFNLFNTLEKPLFEDFEWEKHLFLLFGVRWVGLPIFRKTLNININRVVFKQKQNTIETVLGHIEESIKPTDEVYALFPRPIEMREVDTVDGFRLELRLIAYIEVVSFYPVFFELKADFLPTVDSLIKAYVTEVIKGLTWDEFKKKSDNDDKKDTLFKPASLEDRLKKTGVKVSLLVIDDFGISPSSQKLQEAVEKQKIADEEGKAKIKTAEAEKTATIRKAEGEKQKRTLEGEGDAAAIEKIAKANAKRYEELITLYIKHGHSKSDAIKAAQEQVAQEIYANNIGKLTGTYAPGGGVQTVIPLDNKGGKKA